MTTDTALAAQLAEDAAKRLLSYVRIDTQSDEDSETYPSTAKQLDLLRLLLDEVKQIGLEDAGLDENGYVTATLPTTVDRDVPAIALFAHVDTAREVTGANVNPKRFRYEGGDIPLGSSGAVIRPEESSQLGNHVGHELITTDGTTLLGADDKSGVAEIMAAVAYLAGHPEVEHGPVKVAFNPDEEVGRGVIHFPVDTFGVAAAYTVDGSTPARCRWRRSRARRFGCTSAAARSTPVGRKASLSTPSSSRLPSSRSCRRTRCRPRRRRSAKAMSTRS